MKRWLVMVSLWSFSALTFADNVPSFVNMNQSSQDLSIKYLGQLFGNVSGVLQGAGSGLMGQLFYVLNIGIMIVAAVWLMYSIFNVVVTSALQGQGQSRHNVALIMFRVVVGLALLVPSSTTGYSAAQNIMMGVVVEGTKMADEVWDYALDYLKNGGVIYSPATSSNQITSMSQLTDIMSTKQGQPQGVVANVFQDEACMYISNNYNQQNKDNNQSAKLDAQGNYHMIEVPPQMSADGKNLKAGTGVIYFPGYGDQPNAASQGHACGSVSVNAAMLQQQGATITQYQQAYNAMDQMTRDVQVLAKKQASYVTSHGKNNGFSGLAGGGFLASGVLDYVDLIKPVTASQAAQSLNKQKQNSFIDYAKSLGWFGAGSFYWNLSRWNDALVSKGDPTSILPLLKHWSIDNDSIQHDINNTVNSLGAESDGSIWGHGYMQLQQAITNRVSGGLPKGVMVNDDIESGQADFNHYLRNRIQDMVLAFEKVMYSNQAGSYDPLAFVQMVGKTCLAEAGSLWSRIMSFAQSWAAVAGVCAAANPGNTIVNAVMSWMTPLCTMSATALLSAGFMLNFYVPLYPYLLFMFGVMGWLLYVIEAMVAAPLVCLGMTHPDGQDFTGKAEQALMLALGVFIRPALMIIGFLAGMIMSYIGFSFVNSIIGRVFVTAFSLTPPDDPTKNYQVIDGIWTVLAGSPQHNVGQSGPWGVYKAHYTGSAFADFLLVPLMFVAYGLIVTELINQCFSAIHVVPDMVLRWIGGPQQQDQTERYVQGVQRGMSSAAQQAGQLGGDAAKGKASSTIALGSDAGAIAHKVGGVAVQAEMND